MAEAKRAAPAAPKKTIRRVRVQEYKCPFCNAKYKREDTLLTHKCPKRDRYNDRNSPEFQLAFKYWMVFIEYYAIRIKAKVQPEMQFATSRYFNEFFKFAQYISTNNIWNKEEYADYIIKSGISVDLWCNSQTLKEWIIKTTRNEEPNIAVERSISTMLEWGEITGHEWTSFFDNCSSQRLIMWLESGKLSPWIIYASDASTLDKVLSKFSTSEKQYVMDFITPSVWKPLQAMKRAQVHGIKQILKEYGL